MPEFKDILEEAAREMYKTYCGVNNTRGLMPMYGELPIQIRANYTRMCESAFEVFARAYGVKL